MSGSAPPVGCLADIRVIDASNFLAAPSISMHLGDLGADIVKLERPGTGDELRAWGSARDGVGLYAKVINRNKRSVCADLRTPLGQETVRRLVRTADLVVENYRPGTMEKWGLGYEVLRAINPRIVMLRVTGYGQSGPSSHKPGFGTALEGYAGAAYISGDPDRPPMLPAFGLADSSSGLMGALLGLAAVHEARRSGQGQVVDLALYETMFAMLGPFVVDYDQHGRVQERTGSRLPWVAPRNVYRTRDGGYVTLSASSDRSFRRLCEALDLRDLPADPRFASNRDRVANVEALDAALQAAIGHFDRAALIERLEAADAVVAPVNSVADILRDPHVVARGNVVAVEDPQLGPMRMQAPAGRLSRTPQAVRHTGATVGEHTREVLVGELGFTDEDLRNGGLAGHEP
jgi:crotonobetainyl-CoA:carnitine CoA-transferase CaiB-like acyl-CoA transferase